MEPGGNPPSTSPLGWYETTADSDGCLRKLADIIRWARGLIYQVNGKTAQKDSAENCAIQSMTEKKILQKARYQASFRFERDGETTNTWACHTASCPRRGYHICNKKVQHFTHAVSGNLSSFHQSLVNYATQNFNFCATNLLFVQKGELLQRSNDRNPPH